MVGPVRVLVVPVRLCCPPAKVMRLGDGAVQFPFWHGCEHVKFPRSVSAHKKSWVATIRRVPLGLGIFVHSPFPSTGVDYKLPFSKRTYARVASLATSTFRPSSGKFPDANSQFTPGSLETYTAFCLFWIPQRYPAGDAEMRSSSPATLFH